MNQFSEMILLRAMALSARTPCRAFFRVHASVVGDLADVADILTGMAEIEREGPFWRVSVVPPTEARRVVWRRGSEPATWLGTARGGIRFAMHRRGTRYYVARHFRQHETDLGSGGDFAAAMELAEKDCRA